MTARPGRRPSREWIASVLLALALGSCAPHHVALPEIDVTGRRAAYLRGLAGRETPGGLVESAITLWARAHGSRVGASGSLALAPPDGVRIRLDSMFGTALDLGARADSVMAVLPSRRMAVAADAVRDTLGIPAPGSIAYRMLSGAWRPPDRAEWRMDGESLEASWAEGRDSVTLAVGRDARPVSVTWRTAEGPDWRVEYLSWARASGGAWPEAIRCQDRRGRVSLTAKLARVRVQRRADPARLAVRAPAQTEWVDWRRFRGEIEEIETWLE